MKIVADENLAFTDYFFSSFGEIQHRAGRLLTAEDVHDAQALIVRSVTKVNAALIQDSQLQFVGSATIGTDHLDTVALDRQNITWRNAPGCNAQAVAEYVITALYQLDNTVLDQGKSFHLGIVGLGNVGRRLASMAQQIGWTVMGCDPFVQLDGIQNVSFEQLIQHSHAISIHVPLTTSGAYPTQHLFNHDVFAHMPPDSILINSARGPVVEEAALIADLKRTQRKVVLDVFEHEPEISEELLDLVTLVTPHIAGYSLEGKARGTQMVYEAFCKVFGFEATKRFETQLPQGDAYFTENTLTEALKAHLHQIYDIQRDDQNLRACLKAGRVDQQAFDRLRKEYPLRREWAAHGGPAA